ncbi:hypothetical protein Tco_0098507 [Tanacetum coccineum]
MWESAKTVAPTPNSVITRPDVDNNFVINSTHLKMIWENKFDGYLRTDLNDYIREFLAICDMFKHGETQSKTITSWEQIRRAFINRFFPPSLFNRLLLEIRSFFLKYEPTQGILNETAGGIFFYKSPNQAFQFLDDKVLFKLDWSSKSKNKHHQKSIAFVDGSNSNNDNSRLMEKLEALTIKMDSQFQSLKEEMHEMRNNYNNRKYNHTSKNHMIDDTPMCERHEVNSIQSEGYQNQNSNDSFSHQSQYEQPKLENDSEKSLTELNNDVKNDLEDFKRCICSMRTVHDKLFDRDSQSKSDLEKINH